MILVRKTVVLKGIVVVATCIFLRFLFSILYSNHLLKGNTVTNRNVQKLRGLHLSMSMDQPSQGKKMTSTELLKTMNQMEEVRYHVQSEYQKLHNQTFEDVDQAVSRLVLTNQLCVNVMRPLHSNYSSTGKYWHLHVSGTQQIMVISAVFDDRAIAGILPYIRLQVVATAALGGHYCYLWYTGLKHPYVIEADIKSSGRGEKLFGVKYGQWLYSCKLLSSLPIPSHVSLVTKICEQPSTIVPIYIPVRSKWEHEFGICVAIAFGSVNAATIIEWFELNRMLGVTEFNIYNASMTDNMNKIFSTYEKAGILRVHQMPPPVPDYSKRGSKLSSPASLNDCMLRNMYRYRYMIVIDFDEYILPRKHANYSEMLQYIDKENNLKESWHSYTFRNTYYFLENSPDENQPKYLTTMRYRKRCKPSGYLFASKSFIDPRMCLSVFNHYCWIRFPRVQGKMTIDVSTNTATSHHYRNCNFGKQKCQEYRTNSAIDDFTLQYKDVLDYRVKNITEDLL